MLFSKRKTNQRPSLLAVTALPFLGLVCAEDPHSEPEWAPVDFVSMSAPSELGPNQTGKIALTYYIGSNGCWRLDSLELQVEGATVSVVGIGFNPGRPDVSCTAMSTRGRGELDIPGLPPGEYTIVAGELTTHLTVGDGSVDTRRAVAYIGHVLPGTWLSIPAECALVANSPPRWLLSGMPPGLDYASYLVVGTVIDEDPCGAVGSYGLGEIDDVVSVATVEPRDTFW